LLESETPHYQYHPLFRQFLQHLAREAFNIAELMSLAAQGRRRTLEAWIDGLPEDVVQAAPWLLYWKGVCRLPISPPASRTLFEAAFNLFRSGWDAVGAYLALSGLFDSIAWSFGDYEPFDAALDLLDQVMGELPGFPSLEIEARLTANKLYAIVFKQPWHKDLEKTADRALSIYPEVSDINTKTLLLRCLLLHAVYFGEPQKAETLFDLCRELSRTPDISPLIRISLKNDEANYYRSIAQFQKGRKAVREALDLAAAKLSTLPRRPQNWRATACATEGPAS